MTTFAPKSFTKSPQPSANAKKALLKLVGAKKCATKNYQKNSTSVFIEFELTLDARPPGLELDFVKKAIADEVAKAKERKDRTESDR